MKLSLKEVEHIAELARLSLTEEEKIRFTEQLSAVLDYADRLGEVDTDDIPPTASVLPVDTVLRTDQAHPGLDRDELLANAADSEDGLFKVDVVLED